jgi:hypothetical protein
VSVAETGQHAASAGQTEQSHELLSEETEGYGVNDDRALASKAEHASTRLKLKQLPQIQIVDLHSRALAASPELYHFESQFIILIDDWQGGRLKGAYLLHDTAGSAFA